MKTKSKFLPYASSGLFLIPASIFLCMACSAAQLGEGSDLELGGEGTGNGKFKEVADITFDSANNLYVLDGFSYENKEKKRTGNGLVQKFDGSGKFVSQFPVLLDALGDKNQPSHIAVDGKGNVYVTQPRASLVQQFAPDGTALKTFDIPQAQAISVWTSGGKERIAVVGSRNEIVKGKWAWLGGDSIYCIDSGGNLEPPIQLPRQLTDVHSMCCDANGNFYILASVNQIYMFDAAGKLLKTIGAGTQTRAEDGSELLHSVAVDSKGNIYAMAFGNPGHVVKFDAELKTVCVREGQFKWADPWSIHSRFTPLAIDRQDRLWVAATGLVSPQDPNFSHYHHRPAILRAQSDYLDANAKGVTQRNALLLGLSAAIESKLPYNIAYDLSPVSLELAIKPGNRRVQEIQATYRIHDMYKNEIANGKFDLALQDGVEARHAFTFTPPRFGWYTVSCEIAYQGTPLVSIGAHFGVTPKFPGMPVLAQGESPGNFQDVPRQAFAGLPLMRVHPGQGLDPIEKVLADAPKYNVVVLGQFSDKKDCTPEKVREAVTRFKGRIKYWEVMNEPNFSMKPDEYAKLIKEISPLIKSIDPQAQVLGPDVCGIDLNWYETLYKLGLKDSIDILSVHDYEGHESIDPVHWRWKFGALHKLMERYGDGQKPVWQTERAITGVRGGLFLPASQAVRVTLHRDLLETLGIPGEHNSHYYLNDHGYSAVPSYLWSSAGPHPGALALRTRQAMIQGRKFTGELNFGPTGNKIFQGLRFTEGAAAPAPAPDGSTLILRNFGTLDQKLEIGVSTGNAIETVDSFGNSSNIPVVNGKATLFIQQMPLYVRLGNAQEVNVAPIDFGTNIAAEAKFTYSAASKGGTACLTNGILEVIHAGNPNGDTGNPKIFSGDAVKLPQTLDIAFGAPRKISGMLIFSLRADNAFCSLLDYDLQYKDGDAWKTIEAVRTPLPSSNGVNTPLCSVNAWYQDSNFFVHRFAPVNTDAMRLVVLRTTHGFAPDEAAAAAVKKTWGGVPDARVMLREIEIYGAQ